MYSPENCDLHRHDMPDSEGMKAFHPHGTKRHAVEMYEDKLEEMSARKKSRNYLDTHKSIEKRRRDRINSCLNTLKTLVPGCRVYNVTAYAAKKLEKAEILEMTIDYLNKIHQIYPDGLLNDKAGCCGGNDQLVNEITQWVQEKKRCHNNVDDFVHTLIGYLQTCNERSRYDTILHSAIKSEPLSHECSKKHCKFDVSRIERGRHSNNDKLDEPLPTLQRENGSPLPDHANRDDSSCSSSECSIIGSGKMPSPPLMTGPTDHLSTFQPAFSDLLKSLGQASAVSTPSYYDFQKHPSGYPTSHQQLHSRQASHTDNQNVRNPSTCTPCNSLDEACTCGATARMQNKLQAEHLNNEHEFPPMLNAQSPAMNMNALQHMVTQHLKLPGTSQSLLSSLAALTCNIVAQTLQKPPAPPCPPRSPRPPPPTPSDRHYHQHPPPPPSPPPPRPMSQQSRQHHHYHPRVQRQQVNIIADYQHQPRNGDVHDTSNSTHRYNASSEYTGGPFPQKNGADRDTSNNSHGYYTPEYSGSPFPQKKNQHITNNEDVVVDNMQSLMQDPVKLNNQESDEERQSRDDSCILGNENQNSPVCSSSFTDLLRVLETTAWQPSTVPEVGDDNTVSLHDLSACIPGQE
ncbi:uncharacterized protein LOC100369799 [Saccoglossus kowalevskii]|uniref:Protein enabled homolog n=1 Tax=Saccoglossus kowalevskii TaxID=10224 RepID=A0ABM0H1V3_SACKO|nr:PREDICTED: protein enabled homolog [Saccoglossus kowalevskii]